MQTIEPFAKLFRKYRLRSEFETLAEFGDKLADYNLIYENSIFSHWQKGTRTPKDRNLILTILKIFSDRKGLTTANEANTFMASTGLGYLTEGEIDQLTLSDKKYTPFQAPRMGTVFVGREKILQDTAELLRSGEVVILTGQAGIGKTTIATRLAYLLKNDFPDGVIWCDCSSSILSILHEIVQSYGEILPLNATESEASQLYRTLIFDKKALFIFDNVTSSVNIELLLPNSSQSGVIITSTYQDNSYNQIGSIFKLDPFNDKEVNDLYNQLIAPALRKESSQELKKLSQEVGNLPLALHILSKQIALKSLSPKKILSLMDDSSDISSLFSSLDVSYSQLSKQTQMVLKVCSLFGGTDFSLDSIVGATGISEKICKHCLSTAMKYSLIVEVDEKRYAFHPILKRFLREKKISNIYLHNIAQYYQLFICEHQDNEQFFTVMAPEVENIVSVIRMCLKKGLEVEACELWKLFGSYYWHVGAWIDFKDISTQIYELAKEQQNYELLLSICLEEVSRLYYYDGKILEATKRAREALDISKKVKNGYWKALAHQRYGKLCFMQKKIEDGLKHLLLSDNLFREMKQDENISHNDRYLSEGYILLNDFNKAKELLLNSLSSIKKVKNTMRKTIYESVIFSHLGVLEFLQKNYDDARQYFLTGLTSDEKYPRVRGTYTWLNKLGLALSYKKLGFLNESESLLTASKKQMKLLGIDKSYETINVYSAALAECISDT